MRSTVSRGRKPTYGNVLVAHSSERRRQSMNLRLAMSCAGGEGRSAVAALEVANGAVPHVPRPSLSGSRAESARPWPRAMCGAYFSSPDKNLVQAPGGGAPRIHTAAACPASQRRRESRRGEGGRAAAQSMPVSAPGCVPAAVGLVEIPTCSLRSRKCLLAPSEP